MERGSNFMYKYLNISGVDILSAKGGPVVKSAGIPGNVNSLTCYPKLTEPALATPIYLTW